MCWGLERRQRRQEHCASDEFAKLANNHRYLIPEVTQQPQLVFADVGSIGIWAAVGSLGAVVRKSSPRASLCARCKSSRHAIGGEEGWSVRSVERAFWVR